MSSLKDFENWVSRDLSRFAPVETHVQLLNGEPGSAPKLRIRLYTDANAYTLTASERGDHGYLGCVATSRKPRAGETQHRTRNLSEGALSEDTWRDILADIVAYELVRLHLKDDDYIMVPPSRAPQPKEHHA